MSSPGLRFLYIPAHDLDVMKLFYSDPVGLDEIYFSADEGMVAYDCAGLQFTVYSAPEAPPDDSGWAAQPGWPGGTAAAVSWSVELSKSDFHAAVARLQDGGVALFHSVPQWVGYWSFPVLDPMGNTVELSWPGEDPSAFEWPTD